MDWIVAALASLVAGALLGALLGPRKGREASATTAYTTAWRLRELQEPTLVARDVETVDCPPGTAVYASGLVDPQVQRDCAVHEVPAPAAEFAIQADGRKAMLFLGGVREGGLVMLSEDPTLLQRLRTEERRCRDRAAPYVERAPIAALGRRMGVMVETEGFVQDTMPWQDRYLIRLQDQEHTMGVIVGKDPHDLVERRIRVRGRLEKDERGYVVLRAEEVRTIG